MYEATQLLTSPGPVTEHLCRAITDIGSLCVSLLNKCFAQEDVIQMKRSNLETMKTFLIRIMDGKVEDNALDQCPGLLEDVEVEEQEEEVGDKEARQDLLEEIRKEEILEEDVEDSVTVAVTEVAPDITERLGTDSLARTKEGRSARQGEGVEEEREVAREEKEEEEEEDINWISLKGEEEEQVMKEVEKKEVEKEEEQKDDLTVSSEVVQAYSNTASRSKLTDFK